MGIVYKTIFLTGALAVSFSLFIAIPALHEFLGIGTFERKQAGQQKMILAEVVRPPKKEVRQQREMIRQVKEARSMGQSAMPGMAMKFAPDLSVEGSAGASVAMNKVDLKAEIFDEGDVDEPVVPIYTPQIPYPERARELGIQGTLKVMLIIGSNGKVESVDVVEAPHASIAAEARKVYSTWRFKPGRNKGIPVRVRASQVIEFKLQ